MDARHLRISVDEEPPRIVITLLTELLDTMESIGFGGFLCTFPGTNRIPEGNLYVSLLLWCLAVSLCHRELPCNCVLLQWNICASARNALRSKTTLRISSQSVPPLVKSEYKHLEPLQSHFWG